jgi:hypothetical protein
VLSPRGDRVGLVETHTAGDCLPEPFDVRLAEHLARPALVRSADAAPVDRGLAMEAPLDLSELELDRPPHALAVQIGKQLRLRPPGRPEHGVAGGRLREHLLPRRGVGERFVRAELDHRAAHVVVVVDDMDVRSAGLVCLADESPPEPRVRDVGVDEHLLSRLDIRPRPDRELRVALETLVVHFPLQRRQSRCLRSSMSSVEPTLTTAATSRPGPAAPQSRRRAARPPRAQARPP